LGCFIVSANERIAPADRQLYALRDVTATVESIALITASILSKKLAASLDALIMDVKVGSGAFMKTQADATALARSIVNTGALAELPTRALLTDMDQPLGAAIGNAVEVNETIALLAGGGPREVNELTIALCAEVLQQCGRYDDIETATTALKDSLQSGRARERFDRMIAAQGGVLDAPLPLARPTIIKASRGGFVSSVDCETLGSLVVQLGGGRRVKTDKIDPSVGASIHVRVGDEVVKGQPLLTVYSNADVGSDSSWTEVVTLTDEHIASRPLVIDRVMTQEAAK